MPLKMKGLNENLKYILTALDNNVRLSKVEQLDFVAKQLLNGNKVSLKDSRLSVMEYNLVKLLVLTFKEVLVLKAKGISLYDINMTLKRVNKATNNTFKIDVWDKNNKYLIKLKIKDRSKKESIFEVNGVDEFIELLMTLSSTTASFNIKDDKIKGWFSDFLFYNYSLVLKGECVSPYIEQGDLKVKSLIEYNGG